MLRNPVQKASRSEAMIGSVYPDHMAGPKPIQNHLVVGLRSSHIAVQETSRAYTEFRGSGRDLSSEPRNASVEGCGWALEAARGI